jgi:hypothetical protein
MATNNVIRDNVFIVEGDAKLTFPRSEDFTMARNILYATGNIRVEGINAVTHWTQNLFFSGTGKIEGVRMKHYDAAEPTSTLPDGIIVADPMFNHWPQGDFRFQPASPAHALNLQPIDAASAGRSRRK